MLVAPSKLFIERWNEFMNKLLQKKEGFTIIEVVLVLAIVGLIMLMIFIAWPALQRNQRDTALKNDMSRVASAVASYRSNHNGANPTNVTQLNSYIGTLGQATSVRVSSGAGGGLKDVVRVYTSAKCGVDASGKNQAVAGTTRQAAVVVLIEGGGSGGDTVCQDV